MAVRPGGTKQLPSPRHRAETLRKTALESDLMESTVHLGMRRGGLSSRVVCVSFILVPIRRFSRVAHVSPTSSDDGGPGEAEYGGVRPQSSLASSASQRRVQQTGWAGLAWSAVAFRLG